MSAPLSGPRKASYLMFAAGLIGIVIFHLAPAVLAGMATFMILDQVERRLQALGARPFAARWAAVGVYLTLAVLLLAIFDSFVRLGIARLPVLLDRVMPRLDGLATRFGFVVQLENVHDLRVMIMDAVRENLRSITAYSGALTRGVFQIIVACVAAILYFLTPKEKKLAARRDLHSELMDECASRIALFNASFERVVGAQVVIAAINACVTAVFLFSADIPFATFLTLTTFVCGLVPIVGNILSNTLITAAALTISEKHAVFALAFLVVIHKAEYFLNSRIVGASIEIPMWATLIGLLVGEVLMGVTGVILAPTLLYYIRAELVRAYEYPS